MLKQFKLGSCNAKTSVEEVEKACVGKSSCTIQCGPSTGNKLFGDPCEGTGKWLTVVIECSSHWGAWFIGAFCIVSLAYVASGVAYSYKTAGAALRIQSHPDYSTWTMVRPPPPP